MGDFEVPAPAGMESTVEYHPAEVLDLTLVCYESKRQITLMNQKLYSICVCFSWFKNFIVSLGDSYQTGNSAWRVV